MKKRILQCLSLILCAAMLAIPAAAAAGIASMAAQRIRDRHCRIRFFILVHPFQCFRGSICSVCLY